MSLKVMVEFAQVVLLYSASADYITHITDHMIAPQHLSSHCCRLLPPLIQTLLNIVLML